MKKGKYIDEVIGEILFPLGFERDKKSNDWEYRKEVINKRGETIILTITIYKGRFGNQIFIQFWSTAFGRGAKKLRDAPGYENAYYDFLPYENDEEFKQVIGEMRNIISDYGLAWLEASIEPINDDYFKEVDYRKLCLEHDELADAFAERMNVKIEDITLRESFDVVEKVVIDSSDKSFKEMVPLFLEMSAFLAKVNGKRKGYEWRLEEKQKHLRCYLYVFNLCGVKEANVMVLHMMVFGWARKGNELVEWLISLFKLPPDGYVPMQ